MTGTESERLLRLLDALGAPAMGSHLEFSLQREDFDELEASRVASGLEPGRYLCIHAGARKRDKCWPPQRFADVADQLHAEFGLDTVLTGSADEAPRRAPLPATCARRRSTPPPRSRSGPWPP